LNSGFIHNFQVDFKAQKASFGSFEIIVCNRTFS